MGDVPGGCHSVCRLPAFCEDDAPPLTPSSPSPAICGIEKRYRAGYVQPMAGSSEAKTTFDEELRERPPGNRGGGPLVLFPERTGGSEAGVSVPFIRGCHQTPYRGDP